MDKGSGQRSRLGGTLIAADVGGTHARVGLVGSICVGRPPAITGYRKYACADFGSLAEIIRSFRASHGIAELDCVALAIAGCVVDDEVINVNLSWPVSVSGLREELGVRELAIVNDFEAVAHAVEHVPAHETTLLSGPAHAPSGPVLVVGPGTGLGAALRIPHPTHPVVLATEAGQATLAGETDLEFAVLRDLRRNGARVLIEHVLSGTGLSHLHAAIGRARGLSRPTLTPAQITDAAQRRSDPLAAETVDVFCGWLGSVLGDLALIYGAQGGIVLAGGVLPQMKALLLRSGFAARFVDKGALREVLARTPVRLVEQAELGVLGAASWYLARASEKFSRLADAGSAHISGVGS